MGLREIIKKIVFGVRSLRRPSIAFCVNNNLLAEVFCRMPSDKLRKLLFLPESPHNTQGNQDIFALLVNRFKPGFFLEIGANDGFTLSNTVYLEEQFGWNGILVEANPQYLGSLKKRKSKSVVAAVVEKEGKYDFCSAGLYGGIASSLDKRHDEKTKGASIISVWGTTLEKVLDENGAPVIINFVSIDVEGAEVSIVEQLCRQQNYRFACGCIEYNARQADYQRIAHLLKEAGYCVVWERQTKADLFFVDDRSEVSSG